MKSPRVIEIHIPLTKVISVKIDVDTLKETDVIYKLRGYRNRSELLREAIATYVELLKRYDREELKRLLTSILGLEMSNTHKKDKPQQYKKILTDII